MSTNRYTTWVEHFCSTPQGQYFVQIDQTFIRDGFNFFNLKQYVENYKYALEMIRGEYIPSGQRDSEIPPETEKAAKKLYGLLHARFLTMELGLKEIKKKYQNQEFETCPRVSCNNTQCLPYGVCEEPDKQPLRMYCPCCREVYISSKEVCSKIDGAFFGHSYLLLFLQKNPQFVKKPAKTELRLFGFRIELEDESESGSECEN